MACVAGFIGSIASGQTTPPAVTKLKDVVVYRDDTFYSAFPSIIRRPSGELLVAFQRIVLADGADDEDQHVSNQGRRNRDHPHGPQLLGVGGWRRSREVAGVEEL